MDIGSLTGTITLEDKLTENLLEISNKVKEFANGLEGFLGAAAIGFGVVTAAVLGTTASIVKLGEEGSTLLGVENAFDRLAEKAGTTGEALRGALSEGLKGTVDDMEMMQTTSRLLTTGMKLTTDQALLMGQAAREMGKATGTDATQGLATLSNALTTGRTRSLAMAGITVDLKKGEEEFAKSIGTTVDQLNAAGQLEGKRIAILDATKAYVDRLGVSELSFKERIEQTKKSIEDWGEELAKSVASSPHVLEAYDSIKNAIVKTFGGDSQDMLGSIVGWVNRFSDAVATTGPKVITVFGNIAHGIQSFFQFLSDHEDTIKTLTVGVIAYTTAWAVFEIGGSIVTGVIAGIKAIQVAAALLEAGSLIGLITPIGLVAAAVGGLAMAVYSFNKQIENMAKPDSTGQVLDALKDKTKGAGLTIDDLNAKMATMGSNLPKVADGFQLVIPGIVKTGEESKKTGDYIKDNSEKIAKATTDSINKTAGIWDSYFAAVEKGAGDSSGAQMSALDRTFNAQIAALNKTKAVNENYQNEYDALVALHEQERKNIIEKNLKEVILLESNQEILQRQADKANKSELEFVNTQIALNAQWRIAFPLIDNLAVGFEEIGNGLESIGRKSTEIDDVRAKLEAADEATKKWSKTMTGQLFKVLEDIPSTIASALTGGGGILAAAETIGSQIGSILGKKVGDTISKATTGIGSLAGPIGSAIGALVGPLIGLIANIGGPSKNELAARSTFSDFQKQFGTLSQTIDKVGAAYARMGLTGDDAQRDLKRALDATHVSAEAEKAAIDQINMVLDEDKQRTQDLTDSTATFVNLAEAYGHALPDNIRLTITELMNASGATDAMKEALQGVLDQAEPDYKKLTDMAGNYGISLESLGPSFEKANIEGRAKDIWNDFTDLTKAGADVGGVLSGMSDEISKLVDDSMKFGAAIPENMKPLIEELAKSGQLTDEQGNKITDVSKLTFEDTPLDKSLTGLNQAIDHLADVLNGVPGQLDKIGSAANNLPKNPMENWKIPDGADIPGVGMSTGGTVYAASGAVIPGPRGTDTVNAWLTPGEKVTSLTQQRNDAAAFADMHAEIAGMRADFLSKFPRAIGRAVGTSLVGVRTAS
jgi:hypothetical protein